MVEACSVEEPCHENGEGILFSCSDLANEREIAKNDKTTRIKGSVLVISNSSPLVKLINRPRVSC